MSKEYTLFKWLPPKRRVKLSVAFPSSVLSVEPSLYKKTLVSGFIARALAIFRVSNSYIYLDSKESINDLRILESILRYITTPPYLRKYLHKLRSELRYVGILPPLALPSHYLGEEPLTNGMIREGIVFIKSGRPYVYVGSEQLFRLKAGRLRKDLRNLQRVTVRLVSIKRKIAELVSDEEIPCYWGFTIEIFNSLKELIQTKVSRDVFAILTSKRGVAIHECISKLSRRKGGCSEVLMIFGSPKLDADEIAYREGFDLHDYVECIINTAPYQGVRTIRTYEALYISLALLNNELLRYGIQ